MGVIAYVIALSLFVIITCWCWVTKTFTPHRLGVMVLLTISQFVLAIYIDHPVGAVIAGASAGVEIFVLVDMHEKAFHE